MGARDESQLERGPSSRLASPDYPDIPLLHYHAPLFLNQLLAPICLILIFFLDLNVISFLWCGDYLSRSTILSFSCPVERHRYPDIPLLHYHAPLFLNQLLAPICLILIFFLDLNVISFLWCGDYLSRSTILSFSCPVERHRKVIKCFP